MFDRYLKPEKYMNGQSVRAPNSLPLEILEPETDLFLFSWFCCPNGRPGNNDAIYFVRLRDGTCQGPNFVDQLKDVNWNWNAFLHVGSRSDMKDVLTAQRFRLREGWVRYHGSPSPEVMSLFQNPDVQKVHWVTRSGYLNWVLYSKWDWALMRGWLDDIVAFKLDHRAVNDRPGPDSFKDLDDIVIGANQHEVLVTIPSFLKAGDTLTLNFRKEAPKPCLEDSEPSTAEVIANFEAAAIEEYKRQIRELRARGDRAEEACTMIAREREAWKERAVREETERKKWQEAAAFNDFAHKQLNALKAALRKLGGHWASAKIPPFDLLSHSTRRSIRQFFLKELREVVAPFPGKADAPDKDEAHYSARTGPVPGPRGGGNVPDHIARKYSKTRDDADRDDD